MQTLAFDGRTGASGDMILAALVAVGADPDALSPVEDALDIEYRIGETIKNGIAATTVDVLLETDEHAHDHEHTHAEGAGPNRTYAECREIVADMGLSGSVEADATAVFRLLGEAESRVHGTDLESTHFHEVGADDAIADIVGAALLFDDLDPDRIVPTPVAGWSGEVSLSHGVYPIPTPAVVYLAAEASWELTGGAIESELLTPTGAAILAHFAEGVGSLPPLSVGAVGYGAGRKDFESHPNVLRATVGTAAGSLVRDAIPVLETTADHVTPEAIGGLPGRPADAGARDVTVIPTTMKNSRPGHPSRSVVTPEHAATAPRPLPAGSGPPRSWRRPRSASNSRPTSSWARCC